MRTITLFAFLAVALAAAAQDSTLTDLDTAEEQTASAALDLDSLIANFEWRTGELQLLDGVASLALSPSYNYLDEEQAYHLLVDVWENPPSLADDLVGVVAQAGASVYDDLPVYLIYHEWAGYISDAEAEGIDYAAKLRDMIREDSLGNINRRELGYDGLQLIGWAKPPHYDRERKALHWAKELRSDNEGRRVLNYHVKLLGRHGIITVNAITGMDQLAQVENDLPDVLGMLAFNDGYRYDQFDPSQDIVSSKSLSGLIDGVEPDKTFEHLKRGLKVGAGAFLGVLVLLIALWMLFVKKKR